MKVAPGTASVCVRKLVFPMRIGIYPAEQQAPQRVRVDLEVRTNLDAPARSSAIEDTLNYETLCERIAALAQARHFPLVETLVGELAAMLTDEFGAPEFDLSVTKLDVLPQTRGVGVRLRTGCFDPAGGR